RWYLRHRQALAEALRNSTSRKKVAHALSACRVETHLDPNVRLSRCFSAPSHRYTQPMPLFLGVDGGQSGTTAVIGDETGRVLGTGEAGPCNHAAAGEGRAKLERAINGSFAAASAEAGPAPPPASFEAACFGMSGGPDDKQEILAAIIHAQRLIVTNDAVIALAGATSSGQGIITI